VSLKPFVPSSRRAAASARSSTSTVVRVICINIAHQNPLSKMPNTGAAPLGGAAQRRVQQSWGRDLRRGRLRGRSRGTAHLGVRHEAGPHPRTDVQTDSEQRRKRCCVA
jgi:hypothetical protein